MKLGLYYGFVINNEDEEQIGQVQVRIPSLHGVDSSAGNYVEDELVPWFEPCVPWYGGYQSGSFIVPPVGSIVWCLVNENASDEYQFFLYLGGTFGVGCTTSKTFAGKKLPIGKIETPIEALEDYPNSAIIFKSLSGSSIWFDGGGTIHISTDIDTNITVSEKTISIFSDQSNVIVNPEQITLELGNSSISITNEEININASKVKINGSEV